ncbi:MAG: GAF domain-containing protein [Chloroflexi bacterium]|nr:GAF domain-containing protein [Chloroflexota bacterium]
MAIVGVLAIIHFSFGRDLTLQEQLMSGLVAALALLLGDMLLGWRRTARRAAIPSVPLKSFYNLFNTVDDFLFVYDLDANILEVNRTVCERLGFSREELIGASSVIVRPPERHAEVLALMQQIVRGEADGCAIPLCTRSGEHIPVETRVTHGEWAGREALFAISRDMSHRQQIEAAEQSQRALSQALHNIATAINSTLNQDDVLKRILANAGQVVPHDAATILFIEGDRARVVGSRGYAERGLETWINSHYLELMASPILRAVLDSRQGYLAPDTAADPNWRVYLEKAWVRSYINAPIVVEGDVIGFLALESATPGFFTPDHAERLRIFADQVSITLRNARLYTASKQHAAELQAQTQRLALINRVSSRLAQTLDMQEIYRIVLSELQAAVGAQFGGLLLYTSEEYGYLVNDTHEYASDDCVRVPLKDNLSVMRVRETHQPIVAEDVLNDPLFERVWDLLRQRGTRSLVVAPLLVGSEVIGTLGLDFTEPHTFTESEIEIVETVANQASVAISKAQLYAAERDQRHLAEALRDTATIMTSTLEPDDVLRRILENVGQVVPHDAANVSLLDPATGQMRVVGTRDYEAYGVHDWMQGYQRPMTNTEYAMFCDGTQASPLVIPDTSLDARWINMPDSQWIRSFASAPIRLHGQVIGALNLDSATPGFFTAQHAEHLQIFADQAAIAIENARLYSRIRTHADELEGHVAARTAELEQERAQLQAILDAMGEGVIYDEGLQARYINQALTQLTGYSAEEYTGYLELLKSSRYSESEFAELVTQIAQQVRVTGVWKGELQLRGKNGNEFDAALVANRITAPDGQYRGMVTLIRDVSQQKRLQAQRNRFITNAAHELRTPIANLKTRLYLLHRQPEKLFLHAEVLEQVTAQMTLLVEELLEAAHFLDDPNSLTRQVVCLQNLLGDVLTLHAGKAERMQVQIMRDLPAQPLDVSVDARLFAQAVGKLIVNAINRSPEHSTLLVQVVTQGSGHSERVVIHICDDGPPIPPDLVAQVFEPFADASAGTYPGTRLGLNLARRIVELHGGQVECHSEPGQETVFSIVLPRPEV